MMMDINGRISLSDFTPLNFISFECTLIQMLDDMSRIFFVYSGEAKFN